MSNFWDMVWLMISTFFFVAYLIIMFQIVVDLFRDHELGGGSKVLWVIGLIFIPVLTAIIYIIARGKGMATRQQASLQKAKAETETYIKDGGRQVARAPTSPRPRRCSTPAPSRRPSSTSSRPRRWPEKRAAVRQRRQRFMTTKPHGRPPRAGPGRFSAADCTTQPTRRSGDPAAQRQASSAADNALAPGLQGGTRLRGTGEAGRGVLVFPNFVSAGFIVGGASGQGVLREGGKTVSYHRMSEGSVGLLAGAQSQAVSSCS